jgi:hypothetical protein
VFPGRRRRGAGTAETGFLPALGAVERAKRAAVSAVPDRRGRARPLADAVFEFEGQLRDAAALLAGWTGDGPQRGVCEAAVAESLRRAEALRMEAPALTYEALVARLAELIDPLDVFEDVADAVLRS